MTRSLHQHHNGDEGRYCTVPNRVVEVAENNVTPYLVTDITADPDVIPSILTGDTSAFLIQGSQLFLTVSVDYEVTKILRVQIVCRKDSAPVGNIDMTVTILNVNDNAPVFSPTIYDITVPEDEKMGNSIGAIEATDDDKDIIYYELSGPNPDAAAYFRLASETNPVILVNKILDYDTYKDIQLILKARDTAIAGEAGSHTATATINIKIEDVDNKPPQFLPCREIAPKVCINDGYRASINRSEVATGALRLTPAPLYAVDGDVGINTPITYTIVSGNDGGFFAVDSTSGNITMTKAVDNLGIIILHVMASQNNDPSKYAITPVEIDVKEKNDHKPIFTLPNYHGESPASSPVGIFVNEFGGSGKPLRVFAEDNDFADKVNLDIIYEIENSNEFSITREGYILTKAVFPSPATKVFSVRATDRSTGDIATTSVNIDITPGITTTLPTTTTKGTTPGTSTTTTTTPGTGTTKSTASGTGTTTITTPGTGTTTSTTPGTGTTTATTAGTTTTTTPGTGTTTATTAGTTTTTTPGTGTTTTRTPGTGTTTSTTPGTGTTTTTTPRTGPTTTTTAGTGTTPTTTPGTGTTTSTTPGTGTTKRTTPGTGTTTTAAPGTGTTTSTTTRSGSTMSTTAWTGPTTTTTPWTGPTTTTTPLTGSTLTPKSTTHGSGITHGTGTTGTTATASTATTSPYTGPSTSKPPGTPLPGTGPPITTKDNPAGTTHSTGNPSNSLKTTSQSVSGNTQPTEPATPGTRTTLTPITGPQNPTGPGGVQLNKIYTPSDMAAVGATLGAVLALCLGGLGFLLYKQYGDNIGNRLKKDDSVFSSDRLHQLIDEEVGDDNSPGSNNGPPNDLDYDMINQVSEESLGSAAVFSGAAATGIMAADLSRSDAVEDGSDSEDKKEVKSILTKEFKEDVGYKSVWFMENAEPEVVMIEGVEEGEADDEDDEDYDNEGDDDDDEENINVNRNASRL
ncbi:cadherin-related family member 5 [Discoglossus pictus]